MSIVTEGTDFVHGDYITYKLEEGGCYMADVSPIYYVKNNGKTDRWYPVADVWDTVGNFSIGKISKEEFDVECENAVLWRNYVNGKHKIPKKFY